MSVAIVLLLLGHPRLCIMTTQNGTLNSDYNDESCHTRISTHKSWIELLIKELERLDPQTGKELENKINLNELF